jgi:hypothetical protein
LERDAENDYLALDTADDDPLSVLQGNSIAYRIAPGPPGPINATRWGACAGISPDPRFRSNALH